MNSFNKSVNARKVLDIYLREKYDEEIRGMWAVVVFYRWLSILLSPVFIRASISPTSVTIFSLLVTLSQPLCLVPGSAAAYLYLALAGFVFNVLDCVDGDIARVTNSVSRLGRYSDFQVDIVHRAVTYITLGLFLQQLYAGAGGVYQYSLLIMATACLLTIIARTSRLYTELNFRLFSPSETEVEDSWFSVLESRIFSFMSGLDYCLPLFILLAGIYDVFSWLVWWLLLYSVTDFLYTQSRIYLDLK